LDGSLADEEENNTTSDANLISYYHTYHNGVTTMIIAYDLSQYAYYYFVPLKV
jgi:hypothetical protein